MSIQVSMQGNKATIILCEQFDHKVTHEFQESYNKALEQNGMEEMDVDFTKVAFLNSFALGLLLILRDKAEKLDVAINLVNSQGAVRRMLEIANFDKIFNMP